jgi:serine/threonine protein kinase
VGSLVNGRYHIDAFLGAGGMGSVYRVTDTLAPDRPMALKTIRADAVTADRVDLFKAEFRMMTGFRHPNIASVYDFEPIHGTGGFLFTMEFVDGRDVLSATVGADRETLLDLVVGICRALAYVHSRGVIHFDLKPSNLLVSTLGRVKVLDFGVARTAREPGRRPFGTPAYMAPELVTIATPDHRSDLYSLGVVVYQLFTRRLPFEAAQLGDLLRMHAQDPIPFDRPEARDLASWIRTIIERLCRKEPAERFRSADAVIEAINRHGGRTYELETPRTRESYILSSRFIGRAPELQRVVDFVMDRTQGPNASAPVLLVSGSSGVGKSRLIRETRHHAQLSGLAFVETQCYERNSSDYGPLGDAVKQLVRLAEAAGAGDLGDAAPRELAGFAAAAEPRSEIETAERQRLRLREEATDFLVKLAGIVPYVLCVDDLQWAQPGAVDLLAHLARRLSIARRAGARVPVAVLGTFRDEEIAGRPCESLLAELQQWQAGEAMGLAPLDRAGVGEIVASMLGADPPAEFVDRLARESAGVPFFVEEVMRGLVENGSVYIESGAWAAAHDIPDLPIPASVMNVLGRRVEALDAPAGRLLTVLAAHGRPAQARLLAAATGLDPTGFGDALKRLLQRRMAIELPGDPVMYAVAHDRIREMVHANLSPQDRRAVHRSIGRAIESTWSGELDEQVYDLAQHWWLANDRPRAFTYSRLGAERAWSSYSNDLAIELYGRVLELADDGDEALKLKVTERLGDLHALNGRFDDALARYRQVMAAVTGEREQARLLRKTGNVYWQRGELVAAVDWLWQAAEALGDTRPASRPAQAVALLASVLTHVAHRQRAPRAHVDSTEKARLLELTATYFQLGEVYFFHDSTQMLLPTLRASNAGEEAGGDSTELCRAYSAVMVVYGTLTWWGSAAMYARRLTGMAERLDSPWYLGAAHTYRLILHYYRSEWREGIDQGRLGGSCCNGAAT